MQIQRNYSALIAEVHPVVCDGLTRLIGDVFGATQKYSSLETQLQVTMDEVGDLPPDIHIALLRVLQEREIERIGKDKPIRVDVRVIAGNGSTRYLVPTPPARCAS